MIGKQHPVPQALLLVSTVRADTRSSLVRPFAGTANDFIKTHIEILERTGDVDYTKPPVPQVPRTPRAGTAHQRPGRARSVSRAR
ncbi:hypothetical protein ABT299_13285 [Spirillospora sp. NPDC000708]